MTGSFRSPTAFFGVRVNAPVAATETYTVNESITVSALCYNAKQLRSNSITLSGRRQVRIRFEAGRRPAAS